MSGFFALLDDIATLAKLTLSTVDDTASMAVKTSAKVSAAAVDDVATTPQYVTGITPDRELPIIKKITLGSLRNKLLFILPIGLLLTAVAPVLLPVALIFGGAYLCFEGGEKILERFGITAHAEEETGRSTRPRSSVRPSPRTSSCPPRSCCWPWPRSRGSPPCGASSCWFSSLCSSPSPFTAWWRLSSSSTTPARTWPDRAAPAPSARWAARS